MNNSKCNVPGSFPQIMSFMAGNYEILIQDPMSMEAETTLEKSDGKSKQALTFPPFCKKKIFREKKIIER